MPFSKNPRKCEEFSKFTELPGGHIVTCDKCSNTLLPEYFLWLKIKRRCHSPKDKNYKHYGAKGVTMCDLWRVSFAEFYNYIGPRPSEDYILKRIDLTKNYEPGNVTWRKNGEARNPDVTPKYLRPEYTAWENMIQRCYNEKHPSYSYYGERGISVCDRWKNSSDNFLSDMGPRPTEDHTLDRYPNNDGNYEPGNCRWAIMTDQMRNMRRNVFIETDSGSVTGVEFSEQTGIPQKTIYRRIKEGKNKNDLYKPIRKIKTYQYRGKDMSIRQLSKISGISEGLIRARISMGWSVELAANKEILGSSTYEYNGNWLTIREISDLTGISYGTLAYRANQGKTGEALIKPT